MMNKFVVNLKDISRNLKHLKSLTKSEIVPVIKSDCYGLGVREIAPYLIKQGCRKFFVANVSEAINVLNLCNNVDIKIFVLQGIHGSMPDFFSENGLVPVINSLEEFQLWINHANKINKKLSTIIHLDTGMGRMGLSIKEFVNCISRCDKLKIDYVMSHLSFADDPNHFFHKKQLGFFLAIKNNYPQFQYSLSASGGIYLGEEYHLDMVRIGASLFGAKASFFIDDKLLNPVSIYTNIMHIKKLTEDSYVGYDCSYLARAGSIIATLPIGYANGYPRRCSNRGKVSIDGYMAPIVGKVSMELLTIDITRIPESKRKIGQKIELLGDNCSLQDITYESNMSDTEIMLQLGQNLRRTACEI